jgi:hypothetical protein
MKAFDVTTPAVKDVATWIWWTINSNDLPQADTMTVRVFGERNVQGLERYLNDRFPSTSWYVYRYEAVQPAIEFRSSSEKVHYEKCNQRHPADTIELYPLSQLSETTRKLWRDWFKVFEQTPYLMMLPNQETSSLLLRWVELAKNQFPTLIKDDWIDALVSASELVMSSSFQCQTTAAQAAMVGAVFFGRLTTQPDRLMMERIQEANRLFSSITSVNDEIIHQIHQWVIHDYIQH